MLEGPTVQSRFGTSIVNLGDINGDSMEGMYSVWIQKMYVCACASCIHHSFFKLLEFMD